MYALAEYGGVKMKHALKRTLAVFLAVIMVFGGAPLGALAELDKSLSGRFKNPFSFNADAVGDVWDGSIASGFASGSGTKADPFIIETAPQLAFLSSSVNSGATYYIDQHIRLAYDIVLNPEDVFEYDIDGNIMGKADGKTPNEWISIGGYKPISISDETEFKAAMLIYGTLYYKKNSSYNKISIYSSFYGTKYGFYYCSKFKGVFDGGGYTVRGLYIDTTYDYQGLFGLTYCGSIYNINIVNSYVKGSNQVGGVVGISRYGVVGNSCNSGSVTGIYEVGGVAGRIPESTVKDCSNTGRVTGTGSSVGGVVGSNGHKINNCRNSGSVTGKGTSVGGVAGSNAYATISNSYNTGSVTGINYNEGVGVGGVGGQVYDCTVSNCYNSGVIDGVDAVGGIAGKSSICTIVNCYNIGSLTGKNYVGGIAGNIDDDGMINNSYNTGNVNGVTYTGSVVGINSYGKIINSYFLTGSASVGVNGSLAEVKELTDSEMKDKNSFEGWDFRDTWTIDDADGYEYPRLIKFINKNMGGISAKWDGIIADGFAKGTGDETDPFIIKTVGQLAYLAKTVNNGMTYSGKFIRLENDITMNDYNAKYWILNAVKWITIGNGSYQPISIQSNDEFSAAMAAHGVLYYFPGILYQSTYTYNSNYNTYYYLSKFSGTFDGAGHTVSGVYIDNTDTYQGLFGLAYGGSIRNISIIDSYIKGDDNVGGVAGYISGAINNVNSSCVVTGTYKIGGIAGESIGTISDSCSTGRVSGSSVVGGVTGSGYDLISSCNTGYVTGNSTVGGVAGSVSYRISGCSNASRIIGNSNVGGVTGHSFKATVISSFNTGNVNGLYSIGGIVGFNDISAINRSYNTGNTEGDNVVGGLAGFNLNGNISNSYNSGCVTASETVGGLSGQGGTFSNSYNSGKVTGSSQVGGITGYNSSSLSINNCFYLSGTATGGVDGIDFEGKTTALSDEEMKLQTSFIGWDFDGVWTMDGNSEYLYPEFQDIVNINFTVDSITDKTYAGVEIKPVVCVSSNENGSRLVENTHFTVYYNNNTAVGTAEAVVTGIGSYCGVVKVSFSITPVNLGGLTVTDISDQPYTGTNITPEITVTFNGTALVKEADYTVEYSSNMAIGTATVTVTGIGNFTGTKTVTFEIVPVAVNRITLSSQMLTLPYNSYGKLSVTFNPTDATNKKVTWKSSNKSVATVDAYGNVIATGIGMATITATSQDGGYTAQCTVTVKLAWWQWLIKILLFGWIWY